MAYGGELADKTEILALNKTDALDDETAARQREELAEAAGLRARRRAPDLRRRWHRRAGGA